MILSERTREILECFSPSGDFLQDTHSLLREVLDPSAERYARQYRLEHCLRVAGIGQVIAEREGFPAENLAAACLLHDIGYAECHAPEDYDRHQEFSAEIARLYLEKIGYDPVLSGEMIRGIALHNLTGDPPHELPEDMTPFQMSVRDADDIDRCDFIRTAVVLGGCVKDGTNAQIHDACVKEIERTRRILSRKRGTETARQMLASRCEVRLEFLEGMFRQAESGFGR